ncbi:hypothetical protein CDL12_03026 [Handroanthus impetiginosus]|uniref:Uncharacterized protein n=1 Tax=Handroanthus impetiginosus TaxID=429701 RepID=A0A2G9I3D1_9LAMI|nr:hypothetical protein CDL12_03026 [Handroanthus impetiginosus]
MDDIQMTQRSISTGTGLDYNLCKVSIARNESDQPYPIDPTRRSCSSTEETSNGSCHVMLPINIVSSINIHGSQ